MGTLLPTEINETVVAVDCVEDVDGGASVHGEFAPGVAEDHGERIGGRGNVSGLKVLSAPHAFDQ
jgi:hypothetical protein